MLSHTRIVEAIASYMRQKFCLQVHVYLDYWLFRHQYREIILRLVPEIVAFLQSLGWEINLEKSSLSPSQSFEYLGLRFRTDLGVVLPADHLLEKLHRDLNVLTRKILVTPRELQSFLGLINFFAPVVDLGRLHMRPIQHWLASRWDHSPISLDLSVKVTPDLLESDQGMVGYRVDTSRSTPVKSATGSLPMYGQFTGGVGGVPQWERRHRRLERISQIPSHQSLRNVGGQVHTPIFRV